MPINARESAGTSREKQGQSRDKQGQTGTNMDIPLLSLLVPTCPCLSMLVPDCPCLSLSVPVCPCLSLYVPVYIYICSTFMPTPADEYNILHQYEHSFNNFPCKSHCSNACKPCFNFSFTFHHASSITLSFHPNSSILVKKAQRAPPRFFQVFFFTLNFCNI